MRVALAVLFSAVLTTTASAQTFGPGRVVRTKTVSQTVYSGPAVSSQQAYVAPRVQYVPPTQSVYRPSPRVTYSQPSTFPSPSIYVKPNLGSVPISPTPRIEYEPDIIYQSWAVPSSAIEANSRTTTRGRLLFNRW